MRKAPAGTAALARPRHFHSLRGNHCLSTKYRELRPQRPEGTENVHSSAQSAPDGDRNAHNPGAERGAGTGRREVKAPRTDPRGTSSPPLSGALLPAQRHGPCATIHVSRHTVNTFRFCLKSNKARLLCHTGRPHLQHSAAAHGPQTSQTTPEGGPLTVHSAAFIRSPKGPENKRRWDSCVKCRHFDHVTRMFT